ncbi:MAG: hypothetical protein BWK80_41725 [Desulfobacteraceae bacterium IS3]|jgi:cold shock CspA family protein|nr:MAG: hypothetical protein BWK80_41725 [Desulfobacteraceae bacterium IS3]HAO22992.1 hypothetical protein [Desulfobacteraceae bacterium]
MVKVMIFIDGSWLYANQHILSKRFGDNYRLDYGKLPQVLGEIIAENLGGMPVDVVRTCLFGSNAINYDIDDEQLVQNRRDFYDLLREEYHYEVEVFHVNYRGKRLKRSDRDPEDDFHPQEKCVDIALSTAMLYYAAIPNAYDIAVSVIGDRDFIPTLQHVRKIGKRVAVAGIKESCASEYADYKDPKRLKDFDIIWLGDLLDKLELKISKRRLECQSPLHIGSRFVYTDEFIRKGRRYYCHECKEKYRVQRLEQRDFIQPPMAEYSFEPDSPTSYGEIKKLLVRRLEDGSENKYGFIRNERGDYYFHSMDLMDDVDFEFLREGDPVMFDVAIQPNPGSRDKPNGKGVNVKLMDRREQPVPASPPVQSSAPVSSSQPFSPQSYQL